MPTPIMSRAQGRSLIATALFTTLVACSSTPDRNASLERARQAVDGARSNAAVAERAPLELDRATNFLREADATWAANGDESRVAHLSYLATRQAALAEETAKLRGAEAAVQAATKERDQVVLRSREREAVAARARAEQAQSAAQSAEQRAQQSQSAAQISEQRALQSQSAAQSAEQRAAAAQERAAAEATQAQTAQQRAAQAEAEASDAKARAERLEGIMRDLSARETARGTVVTFGDVLFETGKAEMRPTATRDLDRLAAFLREFPQRRIQIEGHTDSIGSDSFNQTLSERRANTVREALIARGVATDRVIARGYGKGSPVASNDTESGRALNRRVEVVVSNEGTGSTVLR